jgi:hypothetical protein
VGAWLLAATLTLALLTVLAVVVGRSIATSSSYVVLPYDPAPQQEVPSSVPPARGVAPYATSAPVEVDTATARAAAQELLDVAVAAVGEGVEWESRDGAGDWTTTPALSPDELDCDSGVLYDLPTAGFRTGIITDTSTDEHDREVTEGNLAAAERIAAAWSELGYTRDDAMGGGIMFGGSPERAVERLEIRFSFGHVMLLGRGLCVPA